MRSIRASALCLASAGVILGGCASAPPEGGTTSEGASIERATTADRTCIRKNEINSMGALENDRFVFVNARAQRHYLLSLEEACLAIRFANGISIADGARRVCGDGFSFLAFNHPEHGLTRCRVVWIDKVKDKKEAIEMIEAIESDEGERR